MAKSARKPTPSTIVNRTVPRRVPNSELRPREYLTEKEIERLQESARKRSRYGHRDATMILVAYRKGCAPRKYAGCGGTRLSSTADDCMSEEPRVGSITSIR
jgi:hypothetical protein